MTLSPLLSRAVELARIAQSRAHAPYSGKQIGAAVITVTDGVYAACNVENVVPALRVCAERNAVAQAVASGDRDIAVVVVISPDDRFWPPCGDCRRVIAEFSPHARIIMATRQGRVHESSLDRLPTTPFSEDGSGAAP
jgi:cytidine deaminase